MNEIILSIEQTKSVVALWSLEKPSYIHDNNIYNFGDYLFHVHNLTEIEWVKGDDRWNRLRVKTKTPEQLTWFLLKT